MKQIAESMRTHKNNKGYKGYKPTKAQLDEITSPRGQNLIHLQVTLKKSQQQDPF
jgi:hypothetical protein